MSILESVVIGASIGVVGVFIVNGAHQSALYILNRAVWMNPFLRCKLLNKLGERYMVVYIHEPENRIVRCEVCPERDVWINGGKYVLNYEVK